MHCVKAYNVLNLTVQELVNRGLSSEYNDGITYRRRADYLSAETYQYSLTIHDLYIMLVLGSLHNCELKEEQRLILTNIPSCMLFRRSDSAFLIHISDELNWSAETFGFQISINDLAP